MLQLLLLAAASNALVAPARSLAGRQSVKVGAWGPDWPLKPESTCIHGGWAPDPATTARAVPVYRTGPYQFESTEKAAKLFALAELGNIYSRLMNPTNDVVEKRMSLLEGAPELGGLAVASGTNAAFYSVINLAQVGDNSRRATCTAARTRSSRTSCPRSASPSNSSTRTIPRRSPPPPTTRRARSSRRRFQTRR
mmetsp:Transcript_25022/g.75246  ORF Transcript_25022/g.75246 Transcript_25022/m.75246 type:complete len:195 (+) Transcript_25022:1097-1681(+)